MCIRTLCNVSPLLRWLWGQVKSHNHYIYLFSTFVTCAQDIEVRKFANLDLATCNARKEKERRKQGHIHTTYMYKKMYVHVHIKPCSSIETVLCSWPALRAKNRWNYCKNKKPKFTFVNENSLGTSCGFFLDKSTHFGKFLCAILMYEAWKYLLCWKALANILKRAIALA